LANLEASPRTSPGFTLIELMIVLAILGILLAIAIPAYQDYTIRTRLSEGLNLATDAKNAVSTRRLEARDASWPAANSAAGVPDTIASSVVAGLTIGTGGVIVIGYNAMGGGRVAQGETIILTPTYVTAGGSIEWSCNGNKGFGSSGTVAGQFLPASCRP
jgi:type IV pilus assembly protein PilA